MTIEHIRGIVGNVERLPSSRMGNPRYRLTIGDTTVRTAPDSGLGPKLRRQGRSRVGSHALRSPDGDANQSGVI